MVSDDDGGDKGEDDGILRLVGLRRSTMRNARAHFISDGEGRATDLSLKWPASLGLARAVGI